MRSYFCDSVNYYYILINNKCTIVAKLLNYFYAILRI